MKKFLLILILQTIITIRIVILIIVLFSLRSSPGLELTGDWINQ